METSTLEKRLQYQFQNQELLNLALTHPSAVEGSAPNNQRLEFLGDAVLELCVSERLFLQYTAYFKRRHWPDKEESWYMPSCQKKLRITLCVFCGLQMRLSPISFPANALKCVFWDLCSLFRWRFSECPTFRLSVCWLQ